LAEDIRNPGLGEYERRSISLAIFIISRKSSSYFNSQKFVPLLLKSERNIQNFKLSTLLFVGGNKELARTILYVCSVPSLSKFIPYHASN
jgi:hypothetical protein